MNTKIKTYSTGEANQKFSQMMRDVQDKGIVLITNNNKSKAVITAYEDFEEGFRTRSKLVRDMKKGILLENGDEQIIIMLNKGDVVVMRKYTDIFGEDGYEESVYAPIDVDITVAEKNCFIFANGMPKHNLTFSADALDTEGMFEDMPIHSDIVDNMKEVIDSFKETSGLIRREDVEYISTIAD